MRRAGKRLPQTGQDCCKKDFVFARLREGRVLRGGATSSSSSWGRRRTATSDAMLTKTGTAGRVLAVRSRDRFSFYFPYTSSMYARMVVEYEGLRGEVLFWKNEVETLRVTQTSGTSGQYAQQLGE